jgi:SPX domain protein involved in polyphosphate accumulation
MTAHPVATQHAINRFEVKYFVATKSVKEMLQELSAYTSIDSHADPGQGYPIFSVYWDTARLAFFWEKIEGISNRRKLRFRRYGDNANIFIEVKQREDRTLQKRRLKWPLERAVQVFGGRHGVDWSCLGDDPVALEVAHMIDRLSLRPMMGISYRRRALLGAFDPDVRVTFDSRIMYRPAPLDLANPFSAGSYVVDPRVTVLEIKYDHRVPRWLTKFVSRHGLKIVRMSKYCSAVDLYRFGGQNT